MLRSIIISPDPEVITRVEDIISRVGRVVILRTFDSYPLSHDLERILRVQAPQIVFLSIESLSRAIEIVTAIGEIRPGVQVIAIDKHCDPAALLDLMRVGVREMLTDPFDTDNFISTLARVRELLEKSPPVFDSTDLLFSFLPAKQGSGATTIALNTSIALSRLPETNVLLADFDLNSGLIGFMLKLDGNYTVYDAAENAAKMDDHLWPQLVARVDKLDVLPAGVLDPGTRIEPAQVRQLLAFGRRFYKVICLDLSGNMEKFSLEIMGESKQIFVVCTAEIPALHLARQKISFLQGMDLGDRVAVLVNRSQKRPVITVSQIEALLGVPVYATFLNDYRGVHKALTAGREVEADSELGRQFTRLSQSMIDKKPPSQQRPPKRRFLEFISVFPGRYSFNEDK